MSKEFDFTKDVFWGENSGYICLFKKFTKDKYFRLQPDPWSYSRYKVDIVCVESIIEIYKPIEDQPLKDWGLK